MRRRVLAVGNISSDSKIFEGACRLIGFFVASSSSGTLQLYDNVAASGKIILATTGTLAVGFYRLEHDCNLGVFADVGGTINITVMVEIALPAP